MFKDKRGAGDETWTLIWLLVGLLVLGLVAYALVKNWDTLSGKFGLYSGSKNSLSSAAEACTIICGKGEAGKTAWCGDTMDVKGLTEAQAKLINTRISYDLPNKKFVLSGVDLAKGAVLDGNIVVSALSNSKKTIDVSGITCGKLKEDTLIQVDCDLSCL